MMLSPMGVDWGLMFDEKKEAGDTTFSMTLFEESP